MATSNDLRSIFSAGRPLVEQWLDIAEQMAALREAATAKGLDWSQVKALLKAQIQDERDESGNGKRVQKIVDKAEHASAYADMLGLAKMNENIFSPQEPTGREYQDRFTAPASEQPSQASNAAGATPTAPAPLHPDRATPGEDDPPSEPNPEAACAKNDAVAAAVIGQSHGRGNSGQAAPIPDDVPAFLLKERPPLRPLCLNPSERAGYGTHTCHRCLTAAGRSEVAA